MKTDPLFRAGNHNKVTPQLLLRLQRNFRLPISHDEVVHGKGSPDQQDAGRVRRPSHNLRTFGAATMAHPGKKPLFMGR